MKKKTNNLPNGLYPATGGQVQAQISIYRRSGKTKFPVKSLGTYPTIEAAQKARELVTELIGTTPVTKMKIHESDIVALVNEYRVSIGLKELRQKA